MDSFLPDASKERKPGWKEAESLSYPVGSRTFTVLSRSHVKKIPKHKSQVCGMCLQSPAGMETVGTVETERSLDLTDQPQVPVRDPVSKEVDGF